VKEALAKAGASFFFPRIPKHLRFSEGPFPASRGNGSAIILSP